MFPQCFPVFPHGKHCFLQLCGRNIFCFWKQCFPFGKTGKHWVNMCPQQMFLATRFLVLPRLKGGVTRDNLQRRFFAQQCCAKNRTPLRVFEPKSKNSQRVAESTVTRKIGDRHHVKRCSIFREKLTLQVVPCNTALTQKTSHQKRPWQNEETCCQKHLQWVHFSPMFSSFAIRKVEGSTVLGSKICFCRAAEHTFASGNKAFRMAKLGNVGKACAGFKYF